MVLSPIHTHPVVACVAPFLFINTDEVATAHVNCHGDNVVPTVAITINTFIRTRCPLFGRLSQRLPLLLRIVAPPHLSHELGVRPTSDQSSPLPIMYLPKQMGGARTGVGYGLGLHTENTYVDFNIESTHLVQMNPRSIRQHHQQVASLSHLLRDLLTKTTYHLKW